MRRSTILLLCLPVASSLLSETTASACSTAAAPTVLLDPSRAALDDTPPTAPFDVSATLTRRLGSDCSSGQCIGSSCGDSAALILSFGLANDDQDGPNAVGYRLVSAAGPLPNGLDNPRALLAPGGTLRFSLPFDDAPRLAFRAQLVAVDSAGNVSAPSEPFEVAFDGCTHPLFGDGCVVDDQSEAGCSVGAARSASRPWTAQLALLALVVFSASRSRLARHPSS